MTASRTFAALTAFALAALALGGGFAAHRERGAAETLADLQISRADYRWESAVDTCGRDDGNDTYADLNTLLEDSSAQYPDDVFAHRTWLVSADPHTPHTTTLHIWAGAYVGVDLDALGIVDEGRAPKHAGEAWCRERPQTNTACRSATRCGSATTCSGQMTSTRWWVSRSTRAETSLPGSQVFSAEPLPKVAVLLPWDAVEQLCSFRGFVPLAFGWNAAASDSPLAAHVGDRSYSGQSALPNAALRLFLAAFTLTALAGIAAAALLVRTPPDDRATVRSLVSSAALGAVAGIAAAAGVAALAHVAANDASSAKVSLGVDHAGVVALLSVGAILVGAAVGALATRSGASRRGPRASPGAAVLWLAAAAVVAPALVSGTRHTALHSWLGAWADRGEVFAEGDAVWELAIAFALPFALALAVVFCATMPKDIGKALRNIALGAVAGLGLGAAGVAVAGAIRQWVDDDSGVDVWRSWTELVGSALSSAGVAAAAGLAASVVLVLAGWGFARLRARIAART